MKTLALVVATGLALVIAPRPISSGPAPAQAEAAQAERIPVIVELFTSEGCSTCPPVDALLNMIEANQMVSHVQVIGFEEHVDYWNQQGWIDPYSSPEWTMRQQEYVAKFKESSPFTPQLIVDGATQVANIHGPTVVQSIRQAAAQEKTQIEIKADAETNKKSQRYEVRIGNTTGATEQGNADVWLAVTETGLASSVKDGENAGKDLRHGAVLRSLHKIGSLSPKNPEPFVANPEVKFQSDWKKQNLQVVVFVQERKTMRIVGAGAVRVAS
jgi:hypothetical protein